MKAQRRNLKKSLLPLLLVLFASCSSEKSLLEKARWHLENGYFREAEALYNEVIQKEKSTCEALYGRMLAHIFTALGAALSTGGGLDILSIYAPQTFNASTLLPLQYNNADMDSIVDTFLVPFEEHLIDPGIEYATEVITNACSFYTEKGIELTVSIIPEKKIWLGRDFRTYDAFLMRGVLHFVKAVFDALISHNLNMAYMEGITYYTSITRIIDQISHDPVGVLRELAVLVDASPEFLDWKEERKSHFAEVSPNIACGLEDFAEWMSAVFVKGDPEDPDPTDNVFGYVDTNNNHLVDPEDQLWLGIINAWSEEGPVEVFGFELNEFPVSISSGDLAGIILFGIGNEYVTNVIALVKELSLVFSGRKHRLVKLSEFNAFVPFGLSFFPDTISIDFSKLLPSDINQAVPLRRLLPAWGTYDPPGSNGTFTGEAHPVFLIEGELGKSADASMLVQEVTANDPLTFCYTCKPGVHFKSEVYGASSTYFVLAPEVSDFMNQKFGRSYVEQIADDCLSPGKAQYTISGITSPVFYAYWQDPTFNGSLYVDLTSIADSGACAARDAGYSGDNIPADNYSLNKALVHFQIQLLDTLSILDVLVKSLERK